ncbi:PrsW family intramembrane metalloprotease [Candidatus Peribacteria bacterium]|nr:PrsW family intramembrane metalloprotease [Candidatus Peribacteria bacterium]
MQILLAIGSVIAAIVLIKIWTGAMNVKVIDNESLASVEARHPYLPKFGAIAVSVVIAGFLFTLSLKFGKNTSIASLWGSAALYRTIFVFLAICALGLFERGRWHGSKDRYEYFFAFVLGTIVTWILIAFKRSFFETGVQQDPFLMALGITCIVIGWRFLFGPWKASIKATVLGTFLFWVIYAILRFKTREELIATGLASIVAIIPVLVWSKLFLGYHKQRMSIVILAFFAGMLSTVPILFYSELTMRSIQLNFFIFKIVPINYGTSSTDFVSQSVFKSFSGTSSIVLTTLVTYLMVGVIEEISKYWVLRHSSKEFFRSVDDALQLAIVVAIGFAFAENLVNPTYFVGFVRDYLMTPESPEWGSFIGNVIGRSVLTNMVHIVSTGVLGYYFGLAFFASPLIRDQFAQGSTHPIISVIHRMLNIRSEWIYAKTQMALGLFFAIVLHGVFDFTVSLSEVLPGHPTTIGALLGSNQDSFLHNIAITLVPSVLYVVGGFWLLVTLFEWKEDRKDFGAVVETQTFVS